MEIALKIDVDTHQGLGAGVPRLKRVLADHGITATFFIAMGPDNSGRAAMRMFRNPGFIGKMRRTRAVSMYGPRTILSGTILPARPIALAYPQIIRDLLRSGHEVGVHGYDHVRWQDHIDELGNAGIRAEIDDGFEVYRAIAAETGTSFAAPGWRTSDTALSALDSRQLHYRSDTRGRFPYRCKVGDQVFVTPEIPTTLPTMDEIMGTSELGKACSISDYYLNCLQPDTVNVHTIHAETEGLGQLTAFSDLLHALKSRGARFVRLRDFAIRLAASELPVCEVVRMTLPGRAGWISAQAPDPSS
jgi:undecaprenyl phosphate-alpha-L-ara4FN deformylase